MNNQIVPIIISAMVVIFVGLGVLVYLQFRTSDEIPGGIGRDFFSDGGSIDSGARIELEFLRTEVEKLNVRLAELQGQLSDLYRMVNSSSHDNGPPRVGPNEIADDYAKVVEIARRRAVNQGVQIASPSYLASIFGMPRSDLSNECQQMTNERLSSLLVTEQVGPVRVRMLRPAIDSLREVFEHIRSTDADLYARIDTAGSLCVRHIRGAPESISTHSFGLSLDLNIDGQLDTLGDGNTQLGLTILADFFQEAGWYWGAGFTREDSMHFEVGRELVDQWVAEGRI